jgi:hypothetical protein
MKFRREKNALSKLDPIISVFHFACAAPSVRAECASSEDHRKSAPQSSGSVNHEFPERDPSKKQTYHPHSKRANAFLPPKKHLPKTPAQNTMFVGANLPILAFPFFSQVTLPQAGSAAQKLRGGTCE